MKYLITYRDGRKETLEADRYYPNQEAGTYDFWESESGKSPLLTVSARIVTEIRPVDET